MSFDCMQNGVMPQCLSGNCSICRLDNIVVCGTKWNFSHFPPLKRIKIWFLIEILKIVVVDTFKQGCQPLPGTSYEKNPELNYWKLSRYFADRGSRQEWTTLKPCFTKIVKFWWYFIGKEKVKLKIIRSPLALLVSSKSRLASLVVTNVKLKTNFANELKQAMISLQGMAEKGL